MPVRLYKRGRTWHCAYYTSSGKRVRETTRCRDRRAAELFAKRRERAAADPAHHSAHATTVERACQQLLADRRHRGRSPATLRYYDVKVRHLTQALGATTPLSHVDAAAVDGLIAQRLKEGASRHTVAKELGALRGVLRLARRRGEYDRDPATVLPQGWAPEYEPRTRSLTRTELGKLMAELSPPRAAAVAFMVATGARWGEVERARRADIDMRGSTVALRGTKTPLARRTVPILPLVRYLAQRAYRGAATRGPAFSSWPNVRRDLAAACKRAKVPRCSPNDLRRTMATWLVQAGAPVHLVAMFLGHSSSRMVERVYGRLDGAELGKALRTVPRVCQRSTDRGGRWRTSRGRKTRKK